MLKSGLHNNRLPLTVLTLITLINISLVIVFLTAITGGNGFNITAMDLYVLVTIELAVMIGTYWGSKRRNTSAHF